MAYTAITGSDSASWYPSGSSTARHINARLYYEIATNDATTYKVNFYGQGTVYKDNLGTTMYGKLYQNGNQIGPTGSKTYTYSSSGTNHTGVYYTLVDTQTVTITKNHGNQSLRIGAKAYRSGVEDSTYSYVYVDLGIGPKPSYTVSYNANGGSGAPGAQTKWYNETLTLQSSYPTRTGYTFQGWATSSGGGVAYRAGASYTANAGITLYAVWSPNQVTVIQNANGGTQGANKQVTTPARFTVAYNNAVNLYNISTLDLYYTGYHINDGQEWNAAANGSAASYDEDTNYSWATFGNINSATKTVNLYANWKPNTYTIIFHANTYSEDPTTKTSGTYTYTQGKSLEKNTFTRTGYFFKYWTTTSNDDPNNNYTDEQTVINLTSQNNGTVDLYAQWGLQTYNLTYDYDGGEKPPISETITYPPTTYTYTASATYFIDDEDHIPHKKNYKFLGWKNKTESAITSQIYGPTDIGNKEFIACWESTYTPWEFMNITCKRATGSNYANMEEDDNGRLPYITVLWRPGLDEYPPSKRIESNTNKNIIVNPTSYSLTVIDRENLEEQILAGEITGFNYYATINGQTYQLTAEYKENDYNVYFYYYDDDVKTYIEDFSLVWAKWIINPFYEVTENDVTTLTYLKLEELNSYRIDLSLSISYSDVRGDTYTQAGKIVSDIISATFFIIDINTNGTSIGFGIGTKDDDSLESGIFNNMDVTYQKDIYLYIDTNAGGSYSDSLIKMGLDRLGWWSGDQSNE